ncbi:MAG: hypothetical protein AB1595_06440 [bacterium]
MKRFLILLVFFLSFPVFSELSKSDIEEIRKIVREEVQREVGALRQEMNLKFEAVDQRFEAVDKLFHWLYILLSSIIGLIGVMVASVLWLAKQERPMSMKHYNEITTRERWLEKEVLKLKKDIDGLKEVSVA